MTIGHKKHVTISYELRVDNKQSDVIENITAEEPLKFIFGIEKMLPMFEEKLSNLKKGDDFDFQLLPTEAYGEYNKDMIANVSTDIFKQNGKINTEILKEGNVVPMQMKDGHVLNGIIKSFDDKNVRMDFNHVLAGKTLFFTGKILNVREATKEEIAATGHKCTGCGKH